MPPTLASRLSEITAEARQIHEASVAEDRPLTEEEQTRFDELTASGHTLSEQLRKQTTNGLSLLDMEAGLSTASTEDRLPALRGNAREDWGQAFLDSPVMAALKEQYPNGIPKTAKVTTGAALVGRVSAALLTDPNLGEPRHVIDALSSLASMDVMRAITVVDDAPSHITHHTATFTNAAAVVAEGAAKPEATLVWSEIPLIMETIAQHMPVTNQALNHNALLRNIINNFLVNGVRAVAQVQVLTDLAAWPGLGTQAFSTDLRTTLRRAITKAQVAGALIGAGNPAILISAADAETLDLEQLANVVLSPGEMPQQGSNIWRAPLVVAPTLASGFAYVGDLKQIVWYTSGAVQVSVGWVNTQFVENEQTILAETEGVTGVVGAGAIIKADLTV